MPSDGCCAERFQTRGEFTSNGAKVFPDKLPNTATLRTYSAQGKPPDNNTALKKHAGMLRVQLGVSSRENEGNILRDKLTGNEITHELGSPLTPFASNCLQ